MKILLTSTSFQDTPGKHQELLSEQNFEIDTLRGPVSEDILLPIIAKYDAVICGDDEYTHTVLEKGKAGNLRYISKYGVGLDKIDLDAAKKLNISVSNCIGVNQIAVAEHVLALLFAFEKNIVEQYSITQNKQWKRLIGNEIFGKTIGIVGLGAIGKELAVRCIAMGLKVMAFDISKDIDFLSKNNKISFVKNIDSIFEKADIISLHVPHTPKTEYLINKEVMSKLKQCPIIINTARGKLVSSEAIIQGLKTKKIRGYLTDVLEKEPMSDAEILVGIENVIITPHVGSRTFQTVERQGLMAVRNLLKMLNK